MRYVAAQFQKRSLNQDKAARHFARMNHTKRCPGCLTSILKNGGCNHMHCTRCNTHFQWDSAPVEVPCHCLNLRNGKSFSAWGYPPCNGASPIAHAKLAAWRAGVTAVSAPIALPVVLVVGTLAAPFAAVHATKKLGEVWKIKRLRAMAYARARGYPPGSFMYNFHVHGNGRRPGR